MKPWYKSRLFWTSLVGALLATGLAIEEAVAERAWVHLVFLALGAGYAAFDKWNDATTPRAAPPDYGPSSGPPRPGETWHSPRGIIVMLVPVLAFAAAVTAALSSCAATWPAQCPRAEREGRKVIACTCTRLTFSALQTIAGGLWTTTAMCDDAPLPLVIESSGVEVPR